MIAHEFFELDDIIEELLMVTDTLCALEVATTESSSIIPGEAWTLPCLMLKNRIKDLTEKYNTVFMKVKKQEEGVAVLTRLGKRNPYGAAGRRTLVRAERCVRFTGID